MFDVNHERLENVKTKSYLASLSSEDVERLNFTECCNNLLSRRSGSRAEVKYVMISIGIGDDVERVNDSSSDAFDAHCGLEFATPQLRLPTQNSSKPFVCFEECDAVRNNFETTLQPFGSQDVH